MIVAYIVTRTQGLYTTEGNRSKHDIARMAFVGVLRQYEKFLFNKSKYLEFLFKVKTALKRYNYKLQAHNLKDHYLVKVNFSSSGKSKNLKKE